MPTQERERRRLSLETKVTYISLITQALLTFVVVGFSAVQLHRCPVGDSTTVDESAYDSRTCPRAIYITLITTSLGYWFPSPISSLPASSYAEAEAVVRPQRQRQKKPKDSLDK